MVIGCWLLILSIVKYLHSRPSLSYPPATSHPFPKTPTPSLHHVELIKDGLLTQLFPPRGESVSGGQHGRHLGLTNQNGGSCKPRTLIIQNTFAIVTTESMNNGKSTAKPSQDNDQTQIVGLLQELVSGQKRTERALRGDIRDLAGELADHVDHSEKQRLDQEQRMAEMAANLSLKETLDSSGTARLESTRNDHENEVDMEVEPPLDAMLNPALQEYINRKIAEGLKTGAAPEEKGAGGDDGRKTGARHKEQKKDGTENDGKKKKGGKSSNDRQVSTSRRGRSRSPPGSRSESRKKVDHLGRPRVDKDGNKLVYPNTKSLPSGGVREDHYNVLLSCIDFADRTKGLNPIKEKHKNTARKKIEGDNKDPFDHDQVKRYCLNNWLVAEMRMSRSAIDDLLSHVEDLYFIGDTLWVTFRSRRGVKTLFAWSRQLNQQKPRPVDTRRIINWCPGQFENKFRELSTIKRDLKIKKQEEEKRLNRSIFEEFKIELDTAMKDMRLLVRKPRSQWKEVNLMGRFVPLIDITKTCPSDDINAGPGAGKQIIMRPTKFKKPKNKEDNSEHTGNRTQSRSQSRGGPEGTGGGSRHSSRGGPEGTGGGSRHSSRHSSQGRTGDDWTPSSSSFNQSGTKTPAQGGGTGGNVTNSSVRGSQASNYKIPKQPSASKGHHQEPRKSRPTTKSSSYGPRLESNSSRLRRLQQEKKERDAKLGRARSPSLDVTTPVSKTRPTPEELRKSMSEARNTSVGGRSVQRSLLPDIERDNLQRIANQTGEAQYSANGSPILPYLGTKERTHVWCNNGQVQVLQVKTPIRDRSQSASSSLFDPNVPGSIRKSIAEFDELMDTHNGVDEVTIEKTNDVFMEDDDNGDLRFSTDTSVDSVTRITERDEKKAETQPLPRKKVNPGRPSKLQEAGRLNNNNLSNYLKVPKGKSASTSPMSTPGTPKRKLSDEAKEAEETKKKKEDLSNKEEVVDLSGGSDATKNMSSTVPSVDSTDSTKQVAGITPLQEDVSRRTMENVTADLNSTDTNLDQKYLSGTFMEDLIDYPTNDISVSGSDSGSSPEDISSSSGSDDESEKKLEELIEKIFVKRGYQLKAKGDKYVLLDKKEVEELLTTRGASDIHTFTPLKSIKGRMVNFVRRLVCERAIKEGEPGAAKILRQAVSKGRTDRRIAKKLGKYIKEKETITEDMSREDKNKRKPMDKLRQTLKQSYDREADRKAKAAAALSRDMAKGREMLAKNIAEDKEELKKGLETKDKVKHLTKAEKKARKEEKEGWKVVDKKGTAVSPVSKLELQSKKSGPTKTKTAAYPKTPGGSSGRYRENKAQKTSDEKKNRPGK